MSGAGVRGETPRTDFDYRGLCPGADAHTHYFDLDDTVMRCELRALVN